MGRGSGQGRGQGAGGRNGTMYAHMNKFKKFLKRQKVISR
jgi:ribosomal protein L19E